MSASPATSTSESRRPGGQHPGQLRRRPPRRLPGRACRVVAADRAEVDDAQHAGAEQFARVRRAAAGAYRSTRPNGRAAATAAPVPTATVQRTDSASEPGTAPQGSGLLVVPDRALLVGQVRADAVGLLDGDARPPGSSAGTGVPFQAGVVAGAERQPAVDRAGGPVRRAHRQRADRARAGHPPQRRGGLRVDVLPAQPGDPGETT